MIILNQIECGENTEQRKIKETKGIWVGGRGSQQETHPHPSVCKPVDVFHFRYISGRGDRFQTGKKGCRTRAVPSHTRGGSALEGGAQMPSREHPSNENDRARRELMESLMRLRAEQRHAPDKKWCREPCAAASGGNTSTGREKESSYPAQTV